MARTGHLARWFLSVVGLAALAAPAHGDSVFHLAINKHASLCSFVFERLRTCVAGNRDPSYESIVGCTPEKLVGGWAWDKGSYHWVSPTMDRQLPALFTRYDIDNDGQDDILLYQSYTLRSSDNTALFIFDSRSIDFKTNPRLTLNDLNKQPRIASDVTWPYSHLGLYSLMTAPLAYQGTNYVLLMDELFGRRAHPDRTFVAAKYTGVEVHGTDKLDILCSIQPYLEPSDVRTPKRKSTPN